MSEEALLLGPNQSNVGVFTPASGNANEQSDMALVCITAGLLHHVGPHRTHVLLARSLAKMGIGSLRFDLSGIGDSAIRSDDLPALEVPAREIEDAIDELETRGFRRFILFGFCSGAVHAARAASADPRIAGIILVNPGGDDRNTEGSQQAAAQIYLKKSFWDPGSWKNLFTGKVNYSLLFITLFRVLLQIFKAKNRAPTSVEQDSQMTMDYFAESETSVLLVLSDRHAQLYELYRETFEALHNATFNTLLYGDCDHLFTSLSAQRDLIDRIGQWSSELVCKNA
jgi:pimeloyl-ACP methyl ester carboxylesterase